MKTPQSFIDYWKFTKNRKNFKNYGKVWEIFGIFGKFKKVWANFRKLWENLGNFGKIWETIISYLIKLFSRELSAYGLLQKESEELTASSNLAQKSPFQKQVASNLSSKENAQFARGFASAATQLIVSLTT